MADKKFEPKDHMTNLKGKQYLEVKWRLVWFREDHPNGGISTELISTNPIVMRATVSSEGSVILGTGHGTAQSKGNAVWSGREIEKAETAAIGRALAHCGYGTQFDNDDDESEPVDSPVSRQPALQSPQSPPPASEPPKAQENGSTGQLEGKNSEPWKWFGLTEKQWTMVLNAGGWHPLRLMLSKFTPDNPIEYKRWYNAPEHAQNTIGMLNNAGAIVDTMTVGEALKVLADHYKAKLEDAV